MTTPAALVAQAADLLRRSRATVAFTGAGLSTPSGIPDFRSAGSGLWENADPFEVASLAAFRYHPEKFYAWVRPLVETMHHAQPNPAHHALAALEAAGRLALVITQNIDTLHLRAGSRHVLEIHGHVREVTCGNCHRHWPGQPVFDQFLQDGQVPRCADCGGVLKPDVILMGEQLPEALLRQAQTAVKNCDVLLVAGSSLEVFPAADLPLKAITYGARLILVNITPTYLDEQAAVVIHGDVAEILPQMAEAVLEPAHAH